MGFHLEIIITVMPILLLLTFASCLFMTGVIWIIQLVHYPSFNFVSDYWFTDFHHFHTRSITFIVGPVMGIELGTAATLVLFYFSNLEPALNITQLVLVSLTWIITGLRFLPLHEPLGIKNEPEIVDKLISGNWLRTIIWTLRSVLLFWMTYTAFM